MSVAHAERRASHPRLSLSFFNCKGNVDQSNWLYNLKSFQSLVLQFTEIIFLEL
jgi:hypothetical protein